RDFLGVLSGAAATLPHAVNAQQTAMRTIGWLSARSSDTEREARSLAAFREGLAQTGYVEGRNLTIELRFGDGQYDRLPRICGRFNPARSGCARDNWRLPDRASGTGRNRNNSDCFYD